MSQTTSSSCEIFYGLAQNQWKETFYPQFKANCSLLDPPLKLPSFTWSINDFFTAVMQKFLVYVKKEWIKVGKLQISII